MFHTTVYIIKYSIYSFFNFNYKIIFLQSFQKVLLNLVENFTCYKQKTFAFFKEMFISSGICVLHSNTNAYKLQTMFRVHIAICYSTNHFKHLLLHITVQLQIFLIEFIVRPLITLMTEPLLKKVWGQTCSLIPPIPEVLGWFFKHFCRLLFSQIFKTRKKV